jgi:PhzF family phenazine biosynthesis protein
MTTPQTRPFQLVDVFGAEAMGGNPLAVILDGQGLSTDEMQRITRWLDFSETTFLLPPADPGADYRVRIFTLERELPFAGHPTIGSAHAWLSAGGTPRRAGEVVQECGAGLVRLRHIDDRLAFEAPPLVRSGPLEEMLVDEICGVLGIGRGAIVDAAWCDNGPGWAVVLLEDADAVLALTPARAHPVRIEIGVVGFRPPGSEPAIEVRALFSDQTGALREDPVTGSLNAAVAQWLIESGRIEAPFVSAQGSCLGRSGRVYVSRDDRGRLWIAGAARTLVRGEAYPAG